MPRGRLAVALVPTLLGVFFLSIYLLSGSSDLLHNGDTRLRYQTTQAIVDQHHVWIDNPMYRDTRVAWGRGHHQYAFYAPGQTVLMIPLYILGKAIAHHLALPYSVTTLYTTRSLDLVLGALLVVVFYLMALSIGYSTRTSVILSFVFGLCTVVWPDAQSALEQTQVDLFLLIAVYCGWRFVSGDPPRRWWLLASGCAGGLCVFTRYDAAVYLVIVGTFIVLVRRLRGARLDVVTDVLTYGLGAAPWIALVGWWNVLRFGSPFLTGLHEKTLGEPMWLGLAGLTVSPGKGIIWYLPLIFLLPWTIPAFSRRCPALAVLFAVLVVVPLLLYANVLYWHGDPAWGPRYLYAGVPYLVLPLGEILFRWKWQPRPLQAACLLLAAMSLTLQVSAVAVTQWRFWYRLEALEEHTGNPFRWGALNYHYYWTPSQSPIVIQVDDLYQVIRLDMLGDQRYRLTARPTVCTPRRMPCPSNPADLYPVNTLAFWWADVRHPLLGAKTRDALALFLAASAGVSLVLLVLTLSETRESPLQRAHGIELSPRPETARS